MRILHWSAIKPHTCSAFERHYEPYKPDAPGAKVDRKLIAEKVIEDTSGNDDGLKFNVMKTFGDQEQVLIRGKGIETGNEVVINPWTKSAYPARYIKTKASNYGIDTLPGGYNSTGHVWHDELNGGERVIYGTKTATTTTPPIQGYYDYDPRAFMPVYLSSYQASGTEARLLFRYMCFLYHADMPLPDTFAR